MTDTTSPPSPMWDFVKGLLPSINQCLVVIVTAAVTYFGTQYATPPPAPRTVEVIKTVPDTGTTAQRVTAIESELKAFRQEFAEFAARRVKRKAAVIPSAK